MRRRQSAAVTVLLVVAATVWPLFWGAIGALALLAGDGDGPSAVPFLAVAAAGPVAAGAVVLARRRLRRYRPSASLSVTPDTDRVRRGQPFRVQLALDPAQAGGVEVGLVCSEIFQERAGGNVQPQAREVTAWEGWRPVDVAQASQAVDLAAPPDGPYSYDGEALSLAWRVGIRVHAEHGPRPASFAPIWVSP